MKTLTLFSLFAGLAFSGTLSVRFEGEWIEEYSEPSFDWTHFLITFKIDQFPTPTHCDPGCHEEDPEPYFIRYTTIPVTATLVKTGGLKGGKTEDTGAALVMYFVHHTFGSGFQIAFEGNFNSYIMIFEDFKLGGYEPPEASPRILAMKSGGYDIGWRGGVCCPTSPFFEAFYKATLIPEPGTMATLAAGMAALALLRRRFGPSR